MKKILHIAEKKKIWFAIVAVCMIVSIGSICIRGLNYGIDFVGGTIITMDLHTKFDTTETRTITDKYDKYVRTKEEEQTTAHVPIMCINPRVRKYQSFS